MLTQILKNMEPRRPRLFGLVTLVLGMLLMTAVVVRQAYRSDMEREQLGERFLQRTAVLAAGNWTKLAETGLVSSLRAAFASVTELLDPEDGEPTPEAVLAATDLKGACDCVRPEDLLYAFTADLLTGTVAATRPIAAADGRALARRISATPVAQHTRELAVGLTTGTDEAGEPIIFAFVVRKAAGGPAVAAYGFAAPTRALGWFFEKSFEREPLVLAELLRAGRNDSTFVLTLADAQGRTLYRTAEPLGAEALGTQQPLEGLLSGMVVTAQVNPLAETAILGDSFRSRSSLLLVLLAFTIGVAAFALWLIRRETQLAELRDNFIAGVSHELRTPLTQIRMFAESLRLGRMRSPADRRRSLDIIDQESRRLTHLVENVLQFARLGRGDVRLRLENVDLASDVRDAIHAFGVVHRSPGLEIRPELQEHVVASIDRDRVRQILVNLLENAAKYGPLTQRITVGMALVGSRVRLWVDDEGPGIPPAERARVFDEFYRLSRDAGSAVGGTGIGLAIVRQMARAHGGDVHIDDAPGGGARVIVELPEAWLRPESPDSAVVA